MNIYGKLTAKFLCRFAKPFGVLIFLLLLPSLWAHEARPAYLEIKETSPDQFSVLWRTPVLAGMRLPIVLQLPDDVKNLREPDVQELADSFVERRWIDAGSNGLAGLAAAELFLRPGAAGLLSKFDPLEGDPA